MPRRGEAQGKPALEQAAWEARAARAERRPTFSVVAADAAGDEEDGALVERIAALLGRPDAATLPPWEVLGVARNAEPAAVKGAFQELSRLHHPDKGPGLCGNQPVRCGLPENYSGNLWQTSMPSSCRSHGSRRWRGAP